MQSIELELLHQFQGFLEQLQDAFVLIGPDRVIRYASSQSRQLFGHRALHGNADRLLGKENTQALCDSVFAGDSFGARWREIQIIRKGDPPLDLAACSVAVSFPESDVAEGGTGVMLVLRDISGEVGLHRKYKELLQKQRDVNKQLRTHIAEKLREHEDDIAQFTEILQLAPAIFNSFVGEANDAVVTTKALLDDALDAERLASGFRAMHTLKGNARSLGLNLIGGRAHAVEDLLERFRGATTRIRNEDIDALAELLDDVDRAIRRACGIRERLGELTAKTTVQPVDSFQLYQSLAELNQSIAKAKKHISEYCDPSAAVDEAEQALRKIDRVPIQSVFDYIQVLARSVSEDAGQSIPVISVTGGDATISVATFSVLIAALPHLVRNAIVHGIESDADRRAKNKSPAGHIDLGAAHKRGRLIVWIADDGQGLNLAAIREKAEEHGLAFSEEPSALANLIFKSGVSTAAELSLDAGRGVGANAAKVAVEEVGGKITVESTPGLGTRFELTFPNE